MFFPHHREYRLKLNITRGKPTGSDGLQMKETNTALFSGIWSSILGLFSC